MANAGGLIVYTGKENLFFYLGYNLFVIDQLA